MFTKVYLEDSSLELLENILDEYYLNYPQEYKFTEKVKLSETLLKKDIKLSNEEIDTIWRAMSKASSAFIEDSEFDTLRGKFEQLTMMVSY